MTNRWLFEYVETMCLNWITMDDGNVRPCHVCWQCKRDRVSDWVGRCIAESATSAETLRVTLTYGRDDLYRVDHPRSQMLHYEDVQLWLKLLRKRSLGRVRFFCTGEYGSAKGRAHWHLILFFRGRHPLLRFDERYDDGIWPHGFSFWEHADPEKMRYAIKYILKDEEFDRVHRCSTRPEIGHDYFRRLAFMAVEQGVSPRQTYRFPNDHDRFGRPREYRLTRAALYKYLGNYAWYWRERYGSERWPQSELMDAFCDERERRLRIGNWPRDIDFFRRVELERREKEHGWIRSIGYDGYGARESGMLYPPEDGKLSYLELSRGK